MGRFHLLTGFLSSIDSVPKGSRDIAAWRGQCKFANPFDSTWNHCHFIPSLHAQVFKTRHVVHPNSSRISFSESHWVSTVILLVAFFFTITSKVLTNFSCVDVENLGYEHANQVSPSNPYTEHLQQKPVLSLSKLQFINSRAVSIFGLLRNSSTTQLGTFSPKRFFLGVHIRRTWAFAASSSFSCMCMRWGDGSYAEVQNGKKDAETKDGEGSCRVFGFLAWLETSSWWSAGWPSTASVRVGVGTGLEVTPSSCNRKEINGLTMHDMLGK